MRGIGGVIYDSTNAPLYPGSGGGGNSAGNGGGRIAVFMGDGAEVLQKLLDGQEAGFLISTNHPEYLGTASILGGTSGFGQEGDAGTLRFISAPIAGTLLIIR